ncbi:Uncharacterised protein [Mycobacteroides abscessus]|nr:Uncharacterised protein [Mycobacteroides abscessus]
MSNFRWMHIHLKDREEPVQCGADDTAYEVDAHNNLRLYSRTTKAETLFVAGTWLKVEIPV